jgi:hypothetical protein
MSLSEMRKELKESRKSMLPPISKMSKTQVAVELEKMKGSIAKVSVPVMEEKKVEKKVKAVKPKVEDVPSAPAVLEKVAKKVAVEKKEKVVAVKKEEKMVPSKYIKGSAEAKERMAAIRSARGKKTE